MTEVTRSIPVTACFDGYFCSEECTHFRLDEYGYQDCGIGPEDVDSVQGRPFVDLGDASIHHNLNAIRCHLSLVRTRWCCETFGMGASEPATPLIWTNIDGSTVDLYQNAIDNETLRRCTFDE